MFTRESAMPLCIGLIVAVMVHLAVLPAAAVKLRENYLQSLQKPTEPDPPGPGRAEPKKKARMLPRPERLIPKIKIGRHDAPRRPTGAWIPYDHFERLMAAKQAMTAQPALQKHSPPTPHAAVRIDASSPGVPTAMAVPRSQPEAIKAAAKTMLRDAANQDDQSHRATADKLRDAAKPADQRHAESPHERGDPATQTGAAPWPLMATAPGAKIALPKWLSKNLNAVNLVDATGPNPPKPNPAARLEARSPDARPDGQPTVVVGQHQPLPASSDSKSTLYSPQWAARPTAAPRSDRESTPTVQLSLNKQKIGRIEVSKGMELLPILPRISMVSRITAIPAMPVGRIYINSQGRVVRAELVRSTGYAGWDSPILNSLYKWRAVGPQVKKIKKQWAVTIEFKG